ncbi:MAG: winged helix DNA-binding domain-containing protein [Dehalococcoidia bacterium]
MDIVNLRLRNQRLVEPRLERPEEVVSWLGAVQSQEYQGAKWALAMRTPDATDESIERAFNDGLILRTHVMRPTWHFVTPADIRWLLELTASRVNAKYRLVYRELELDEPTVAKTTSVLTSALRGGKHLTRAELADALRQSGIPGDARRFNFILQRAELDAVVCSGPRRGKQFTYVLLDERAPVAKPFHREEALAELTRRYFTSHGPATVQDFAWWSGLTIRDIRVGIDMLRGELVDETIDGKRYWLSLVGQSGPLDSPVVHLLPQFDEFLVAYRDRSAAVDPDHSGHPVVDDAISKLVFTVDGRVAGTWSRTPSKGTVGISWSAVRDLGEEEIQALAAAAERYGQFLGVPVALIP